MKNPHIATFSAENRVGDRTKGKRPAKHPVNHCDKGRGGRLRQQTADHEIRVNHRCAGHLTFQLTFRACRKARQGARGLAPATG
jgi:hypothetical protein